MAFYDKFPYTNFQEINLDRIIQELTKVKEGLNFVIENASLKYADPIQWNITTQYQANTVVIDPATGIAYISTKPVPNNILITDTGYWTPIFDLSDIFTDIEELDTKFTGEINQLDTRVTNSEEAITTLNNDLNTVSDKVDTNTDSINVNTAAIAELQNQISVKPIRMINLKQYGAAADGVTDDSEILNDAIDNADIIYIPAGSYLIAKAIYLSNNENKYIFGETETNLLFTDSGTYDTWVDGTKTYAAMIKMHDCANITFNSVNMQYTSNIQDNIERLMVDISGGKKITIEKCEIKATAGTARNMITPIWARHHSNTATNDRITIKNCKIENTTGNNGGGCFWNSSTGINILMDNCNLIHSTGDEAIATWGADGYPLNVRNTEITLKKVGTPNATQAVVAYMSADLNVTNCRFNSEDGNAPSAFIRAHNYGRVIVDQSEINITNSNYGTHVIAFANYGTVILQDSVFNYVEKAVSNNPVIYAAGANGTCLIDNCVFNISNQNTPTGENTREFINVQTGTTFKMANSVVNISDFAPTHLNLLRNIINTSCKYFMMNNNIYNTADTSLTFNSFGATYAQKLNATNNLSNASAALTPLWNQ